jgi:hypothetical protein
MSVAGPLAAPARAAPLRANPCQLPVVGNVCDAVSAAVTRVAQEAGDFVMRGVTAWVTNAAVWVTGKVGELIDKTASPDLAAGWFQGQYGSMVGIAGALAMLMLMLAVIQSVIAQDIALLARAALGYLPMAFILAAVAIAAARILIAMTDDLASGAVAGLGTSQSANLLQTVGDAYKHALDQASGIPLFGVFLGAIILAVGAFVLWLELVIRDAAIYVCVFFLPLTFVAMVWPATSRWARRLVELLIAVVLAKFVIVAILSLASAALTNASFVQGDGNTFEQMIAGAALLVLAAWSPFALLRLIPMMEAAAVSVVGQRSTMAAAAGSAGVHSPAAYMRQAMSRRSGSSNATPNPQGGETAYQPPRTTEAADSTGAGTDAGSSTRARASWPSTIGGGTIEPRHRDQGPEAPSSGDDESPGTPWATGGDRSVAEQRGRSQWPSEAPPPAVEEQPSSTEPRPSSADLPSSSPPTRRPPPERPADHRPPEDRNEP